MDKYQANDDLMDMVTAVKLTEANADHLAHWCGGSLVEEIDPFDSSKRYPAINVPGMNGSRQRASVGDYIAQDATGTFFKSTPNMFEKIYTAVD